MSDTRMYPIGRGTPKSRPVKGMNVEFGQVEHQRTRVTAAQVNAGFTLLPALKGVKWRLIDIMLTAVGGAAGGSTSVDITQIKGGVLVRPMVSTAAGLASNAPLRAGAANTTLLPLGATFTAGDSNTPVTIAKVGGNLSGATHIDVALTYTAE